MSCRVATVSIRPQKDNGQLKYDIGTIIIWNLFRESGLEKGVYSLKQKKER